MVHHVAQPILPNSHQPKQNRADSGMSKIIVHPTGTPSQWLVGQRLVTKSNLCPNSVKTLSNICILERKVQVLSSQVQGVSSGCLESVEFLSYSKAFGQSLDMEIQDLSRHCPIKITTIISF